MFELTPLLMYMILFKEQYDTICNDVTHLKLVTSNFYFSLDSVVCIEFCSKIYVILETFDYFIGVN